MFGCGSVAFFSAIRGESSSPRRIVVDERPKADAHILAMKHEAQKPLQRDAIVLQRPSTALTAKDMSVQFDTAAFRAFLGGDFSQAEEVRHATHGRHTRNTTSSV